MPTTRSSRWVLVLGLLASACGDQLVPVAPVEAVPVETTPLQPVAASSSQALTCRADVVAQTMECGDARATAGAARGDVIILGGQNVYVKLINDAPPSRVGSTFTVDVKVQNLIAQALGTTNGTSGDGTGLDVFFQTLPTVTGGTGTISITNATNRNGAYTGSGQTYYRYPGALLGADNILSQNEISSALQWVFNVPATVTAFTFTVYVNANVVNASGYVTLSPGTSSVIASGTQALTATVKSAVGNTIAGQTVTYGTSDAAVATVASDGTITAVAPGLATITATSTTRTGTHTVRVCPNLSLGGVSVITGPTAASFCLAGASGNEYVVIPHNGDPNATLGVAVTGTGIAAVSGAPTPYRGTEQAMNVFDLFTPRRDVAAESMIRARERELEPLMASARATMARQAASPRRLSPDRANRAITPGVPAVGDVMTLNVSLTSCSAAENQTATVKSVGTRAIIMAQDNNNQINTFTQAEYDAIAASFDNTIYPLITNAFGAPTDIDNNGGRIVILYTRKVNQMTPPASSSYTGGFVYSRDLVPAVQCATSNLGEMFYMLAPDSTGIDGNVRTATFVKGVTTGTIAHEFQHLINASRRLYITAGAAPNETVWLNEGLSHIAEELLYYNVSGNSPRADIAIGTITSSQTQLDAFNNYGISNFSRLSSHLQGPESSSPTQPNDNLATRGATWAFLRYAADRRGGTESTLWAALARDATLTGTANLTAALGTSVDPWMRDFAASLYADNIGGTVPANYATSSWNYRSVFDGGLGGYSLAVVNPTSGVAYSPTLALGGGASYLRMGVPATTFATVSVAKSGGGVLPSTLSVMVVRRK